jgi:hypothetical protein
MPQRLSELNEIFQKHAKAISEAKKAFKEEIAAQARILSPTDAFEARMRCLAILQPHICPSDEKEEVEEDEEEASTILYQVRVTMKRKKDIMLF